MGLARTEVIRLDGSGSFDPEGAPLHFRWSQVSGPPVTLNGVRSPSLAFEFEPPAEATTLRFRLVVSDGTLESAPAEVSLRLESVALNPQPYPPSVGQMLPSGAFLGALDWPGLLGDRVWWKLQRTW
jgi:hypothetical protein